jgi:hypothetical protein
MVKCRGVIAFDHTQGHITVGRTPLDERSARCRDLYLTIYNTHNRQTSMPPAGFEPAIPAGDRPQTFALDKYNIHPSNSSDELISFQPADCHVLRMTLFT